MDSNTIEALLKAQLPDCDVSVQGGGGKFQVTAIGEVFDGLNAVKRQQKIYQILNEHIVSGAIHAVNMQLMTQGEASGAG